MRQEVQRQKVQAHMSLHYKEDVAYVARMIAQVKVTVEQAVCVHCGTEYMPRFLGDQVCGRCRS